jgi:hypothetical protein
MLTTASNGSKQYLVWLLALILTVFGLRYIKEFIAFVLEKLYQVFIQNNSAV